MDDAHRHTFGEANEKTENLKTKEERSYEALREVILSGEIEAGEFLSQRALASRIGCAVVTLRAALRQLESEGLIENVPRWGVRVPVETRDSISERYYVREVFEVEAVRQIVRRREALDPQELYELARRCDERALASDAKPKEFGVAHFSFHQTLVATAGSPLLASTYQRVNLKSLFLWNAVHLWKLRKPMHVADHENLVEVIWSENEDTATGGIRDHIRRGLGEELSILSDQE